MRALVVGYGASGQAAARLFQNKLGEVFVYDEDLKRTAEAEASGCSIVSAEQVLSDMGSFDRVIPSPGVAGDHQLLAAAIDKGVDLQSEIDLAFEFLSTPVIAVTGTNGKSTVTSLVGAMLEADGRKVFVGGNLGTPLSDAVDKKLDYCVAEVSSFQLETSRIFRPEIATILNVAPDHLDRHGDFESYIDAKWRVLAAPKGRVAMSGDHRWWENRWRRSEDSRSQPSLFTVDCELGQAAGSHFSLSRQLTLQSDSSDGRQIDRCRIAGAWPAAPHDYQNVAAAAELARLAGAALPAIQTAVENFKGLPHRLEFVAAANGVEFWNDSKATNVAATVSALRAFDRPVVVLLGGEAKTFDFEPVVRAMPRGSRAVVYGASGGRIAAALAEQPTKAPEYRQADGLDEAFREAAGWAAPGEVVLLAPASASFDEFENYAARGRRFRALVDELG